MKLLFENWRKYLIEVDTDDDGIDDERELAIIDKGELEPEEDEPSTTKGSLYLSEKAKSEIHSYLKAWFSQAAAIYRNDPDPENPYKVKQLVRDLRKGVARQPHKPYSANVSFNHMLKVHIEPGDQEAVINFLGMLADKVEQKSISLDHKYFFNELDGLFHIAWLQATAGDT